MTGSLSVVFAGDVDHGKSTLLGRLKAELRGESAASYAELLDGLVEERVGEYTMDTTQVVVMVDGVRATLIDVPGHAALLRNMVTGATRADSAVLVVAADEGATVQTANHIEVLALLGITQAVVAVTKMDIVEFDQAVFARIRAGLTDRLGTAGITATDVIPVYAPEGDNVVEASWRMPWYAGPVLVEAILGPARRARSTEEPRFTIQSTMDGRLLGRVDGGEIRVGQELAAYPGGRPVRVRAIERYGEPPLESAARGASVALTISAEDGAADGQGLGRGAVLGPRQTCLWVTSRLRVRLLNVGEEALAVPSDGLSCRLASRQIPARLAILHVDADASGSIEPGGLATVTVELTEPAVVERFVRGAPYGRMMVCRDGLGLAAAVVAEASPDGAS